MITKNVSENRQKLNAIFIALIYISIIAVTVIMWYLTKKSTEIELTRRTIFRANVIGLTIDLEFKKIRHALLDVAAHFENKESVTNEELKDYLERAQIFQRINGLQGIAYTQVYTSKAEAETIIKRQRALGVKDFKIWPESESDLRTTIVSVYPQDWRNQLAYGYDMASDSVRREAMERAFKTQKPSLTRPVSLVQEGDTAEYKKEKQPGFMIYMPHYYFSKNSTLTLDNPQTWAGSFYAIIRVKDFLESMLGDPDYLNESIQYEVYMNSQNLNAEAPIYTRFNRKNFKDLDKPFEHTMSLPILGQELIIKSFALPHAISNIERYAPEIIIGLSLCFTFLISLFIVRTQLFIRREVRYAKAAEDLAIKAEAANQAKSSFLANMSHEIRTPLGAIIGFSELVVSDQITGEKKLEMITNIRKNGDILTRLLSDILDIARVEAGKLEIEKEAVCLIQFTEDLKTTFNLKVNEKNISLIIVKKGPVENNYAISTDPIRLKQILSNLLSNAIRFTENGRILISYGVEKNKQNKDILFFEVEDTGIGISKQNQENLFKPFEQADISYTRKFGGTGLGLALSRRLAGLLGGKLFLLKSDLGVGSTFRLEMPYEPANMPLSESLSKKQLLEKQKKLSLEGRNILLVEDSPDNQEIFTLFLNQAQAKVSLAKDGYEALNEGIKPEYDVILMDIQIPYMDGKSVTKELRKKGVKTPILAVTAHAQKNEIDACLQAGCDGHIAKPLTREKLIETIQEALQDNVSP